jgi:hypothetical protein
MCATRHRMPNNLQQCGRHRILFTTCLFSRKQLTHLQDQLGDRIGHQLGWRHLKCCQCRCVCSQLPSLQVASCWQGLWGRQRLQGRPNLGEEAAQHSMQGQYVKGTTRFCILGRLPKVRPDVTATTMHTGRFVRVHFGVVHSSGTSLERVS